MLPSHTTTNGANSRRLDIETLSENALRGGITTDGTDHVVGQTMFPLKFTAEQTWNDRGRERDMLPTVASLNADDSTFGDAEPTRQVFLRDGPARLANRHNVSGRQFVVCMGFSAPHSSDCGRASDILPSRGPFEIRETVVEWVKIPVMAVERWRVRKTDERFQYQTVNESFDAAILTSQGDPQIRRTATNRTSGKDTTGLTALTLAGVANTTETADLVDANVPDDRLPGFIFNQRRHNRIIAGSVEG